jgi:ankyrin repeat protein
LPYFCNVENEGKMLRAAAISDNVYAMRELFLMGFNPNVLDKESMSPLHWACRKGSLQTATVLI